MTRVLMISKACIVGIYQRKLELIAEAGIDLLAVVPPFWRDERGEQVFEQVYTEGYEFCILPLVFNGNFHLHFYRGLQGVIREFMPDIVHIDEEPYNLATWQALYHSKKVNAKTLFFSWQNIKRDYPPPFSWGEQWVLNNVDYALMGTDSAGKVWREKAYTGKMVTIPQFGTDPTLFTPVGKSPDRPFTVGYFGRVVEEKGIHHLLQAVTDLDGDWQLKIIGGGPNQGELQALANQSGIGSRIAFIGQIPSTQMPEQYQQLDVFVLPSLTRQNWKEQFGRVIVEAMASGVAVIGSDSGAIPYVIGDAGLIYPEGDIDALRQHLCTLQNDANKRIALAEKGRDRVLDHFTHESVAKATVAVYNEMMSERKA